MYSSIVVNKSILAGSSSNIPIFIPISLDIPINRSHHDVVTKIKLPLVVEKRSLDISLHNVGSIGPICIFLSFLQHLFDVL